MSRSPNDDHEATGRRNRLLRRVLAHIGRVPPDVFWFGLAIVGALTGFALQLVDGDLAPRIGVLCLVIGFIVGFGRIIYAKLGRIERLVGNSIFALISDRSLSPVAVRFLARHHQRSVAEQESILNGVISTEDEDEANEWIKTLSQEATHDVRAVDHLPLSDWFTKPEVARCLDTQLRRIDTDDLKVLRLRIVTPEQLADRDERVLLREYIRRHDDAGAELRLVSADRGRALRNFYPRTSTLLVDVDHQPACFIGHYGDDHTMESAVIYLRRTEPVGACADQWKRLWTAATKGGADRRLRDVLDQHRDDPPFDAAPTAALAG
ncbi:hypothetical protein [Baekduia sp.]|jgi:hypothetical protein|uniref:hypothetical protein n=1 Tax=Baekduia sp. TaxID=2600305 RepID=UPI002E0C68BC|nr:hypothetical protein [Baekduia sp.]